MTNAPTETSGDWLGNVHTSLLAWCIPQAAILAGLLVSVSVRALIRVVALIWRPRRCNRTRCRYTGPDYLAVIVLGAGRVTGRHIWMDLFGRDHLRRKQAHVVGYRAGMGKVLVAHDCIQDGCIELPM